MAVSNYSDIFYRQNIKDPIISYTWVPAHIRNMKIKGFEPSLNNKNELYYVEGDILYTTRMNLKYVFEEYTKDCIIIADGVDCGLYEQEGGDFIGSPVHYPTQERWRSKIPSNVKYLFSTNTNSYKDSRIIPLPYGVQKHQLEQIKKLVNSGYLDGIKRNLLYVNFSPKANPIRVPIAKWWANNNFSKVNFNIDNNLLPYEIGCYLNYQWISQSRFVLCPDGNGLDSYRIWESLYLGAIPVVKNLKTYSHPEYLKMPLLKVNDMIEMKVSAEELLNFNPGQVDLSFLTRTYWDNKIKAALNIGNYRT